MPVDFLTFNGEIGFSGQGNFSSALASEVWTLVCVDSFCIGILSLVETTNA